MIAYLLTVLLCYNVLGTNWGATDIAMIGTSDQSCWLAEACKIFLLNYVDVLQ